MALKGIDIFKLSPKTNCKDCGLPTCMAFCMKAAGGAIPLEKCPHMGAAVIAQLSAAAAPPMKTLSIGPYSIGGETVLFRHEKNFVNPTRYGVSLTEQQDTDAALAAMAEVDYERIGERMHVELVLVFYGGNPERFVQQAKKAAETGRTVILDVESTEAAKAALEALKDTNPVLNGANAENYKEMNDLAAEYGVILGIKGGSLAELYDTAASLEALGNQKLLLNARTNSIRDAFADAVQIRRAGLKDNEPTFGYPTLVNTAVLAPGNPTMQAALASLFTMKYGSIVILEAINYAQALPLYGLRQNLFTDPQKPMKVEPGIYALNGADENAVCLTTVDFALTYFVVSGEVERSGVPCNMFISDAGGYSVLTAWAAGRLSASSIARFIAEQDVPKKIRNRTLILPGKVAVLKRELEELLPDWKIVVGPNEAVQLVQFLKDYQRSIGEGA